MLNSKIILCFLFSLFLYNASKASSILKPSNVIAINEMENKNEAVCVEEACTISCYNGIIGNIWKDFPNNTNCKSYNLLISDYVGKENEIISKEWFSKINDNIFINSLSIRNSSFEIIKDDAFNSSHFTKTTTLYLEVLKVQHLPKYIFNGLVSLKILQIKYIPLKTIDENVLYPMRNTLIEFGVSSTKQQFSLKNLTGSVELLKIQIIYLHDNSFGDLIDENSFTGVQRVETIILGNSKITSLHERTFDHMNINLKYILLGENKLTTLSARVFLYLLKDGVETYLEDNPWICDCNLLDLKYLLQTYPTNFGDVPTCASPAEFKDQPIVDSNFCKKSN